MTVSENKFIKNLLKLGIVSLSICIILFILFHMGLGKIQLDSFSASGTFIIFLLSFVISFSWLFCFWRFDSEKRKPFFNVLTSFLSAFLIEFFLTKFFERIFLGLILSSVSICFISVLKNILIPSFSFFICFWLFSGRLYSFSDSIDEIIFGSFSGIGIAAAFCISDFFKFNSISIQFVAGVLISRTAIFAASGAFAFLLICVSRNIVHKIIAFLSFPLILTVENVVRFFVRRSIIASQSKFFEILIPVIFTIIIFALILFLIHQVSLYETEFVFRVNRFGFYGAVMLFCIAVCAVFIQADSSRTVKIVSPNSKISFKLPSGFEKVKKIEIESILAVNQKSKANYVRKANGVMESVNLEVDFTFPVSEHFMREEVFFSPVNGCHIYELPSRPMPPEGKNPFDEVHDLNGKPKKRREMEFPKDERKAYSVIIKKGDACIELTFDGAGKNCKYITDVIKLVSRTLTLGE